MHSFYWRILWDPNKLKNWTKQISKLSLSLLLSLLNDLRIYVIFTYIYMAWNSLLVLGLENSAVLFNSLACVAVTRIIQFYIVTPVLDVST